jgi:hypothetical protein
MYDGGTMVHKPSVLTSIKLRLKLLFNVRRVIIPAFKLHPFYMRGPAPAAKKPAQGRFEFSFKYQQAPPTNKI